MTIFQAAIHYRREKPYGVGRTPDERHSYIVGGWRGEIIDGLENGRFIYTGVCETKQECAAELIQHLKAKGLSGKLRIV